ncbi:MAG: glucose 1-dehydrogenase [Spirochaetes bacterium]|nr:glucose 1-dehydrogenase [Spirochaetota bacterium]
MNVKELFDLKGKKAIVTGGGRGIGSFISAALAEAGADLIIASRKMQNLEKEAKALEPLGVRVIPIKCDMESKEDIDNLVKTTMKEFGAIDILVNNAGITWGAPTLDFPLDKWDKVFNINVRGLWILTQQVAKIMKEKGGGKIINISSVFGSRGSLEIAHPAVPYNSSKAAVEVLTKNLAVKLGQYNIQVNAIAPGFFHTDMMEYVFKPEMKPVLDAMVAHIPLSKVGEENEIKGLALFLASRASDYVTGAVIPVDGGLGAK